MDYGRWPLRHPISQSLTSDLVDQYRPQAGDVTAHLEELLAVDREMCAAVAAAETCRPEQLAEAFGALSEARGSL